ncbi:MAG TPA: aspartate--ammonia ligase [Candidatus Acidoferrum sp.]|nr:aspartate--ammonia ligase [Candidatus Acidoferrum sp.]
METQRGIKFIKDRFQRELAAALNLERISAPLFVRPESGLNDDLNGIERPVSFDIKALAAEAQVVQSLAKWKRFALKQYGFEPGSGLYTDMNAIRRDEDLDNLHSIYVDQWDWEAVIEKEERNFETLKATVRRIYACILSTQRAVQEFMPKLTMELPDDIFFLTSQELEDMYPGLSMKERENAICKDKGAVFLMQIGDILKSGLRHDGRAPDYDDWKLNGDILVWYEPMQMAFELSSMGIRVDEDSLVEQCDKLGLSARLSRPYHQMLVKKELPYTIGGGIGQSRLCMLFLEKIHIGEVQASVWPADMLRECEEQGIKLL